MAPAIQKWSIALILFVASFGIAAAENDKTKAKELYLDGKAKFDQGDYEGAMKSFVEAYNLSLEPALLYNLGLTAELSKDIERAIAYYEVYLEELPNAPDAAEVKKHLQALKPNTSGIQAPPEEPKPKADSTLSDESKTISVLDEEIPKSNTDGLLAAEKDKQHKIFWPGVVLGAGSLVLASGAITGIAAYRQYNNLEVSCAPKCTDKDIKPIKSVALAADIQLGIGIAAAITGTFLWIGSAKKEKETVSNRPRIAPIAASSGGGIMMFWRF